MWADSNEISKVVKTHRKQKGSCEGWGKREWELMFSGYKISVLQDEKFLDIRTTISIFNTTEQYKYTS